MATNRAVWLSSFSSPAQVIDLPVPQAGPGSAVVQVLATYIPPYTKGIRDGTLNKFFNLCLPLVPNPSHVGRVHATGPDAVSIGPGDLVYFCPLIKARDDPAVSIVQGHHGGDGPRGQKLMQGEWRDGALQQYQKVPLEGLFVLSETRLCRDLGYEPFELQDIPLHYMAYGALVEAGQLRPGDTVIIGPATGAFSASAVELALLLGATVVALGRSRDKLERLGRVLGASADTRYRYVVMTGDVDVDARAILAATPDGGGAEMYNDWSSSTLHDPPYFDAAFPALKNRGKVVLSGGPSGVIHVPAGAAMYKDIQIIGKLMASRESIEATIRLITSGLLKVGRKGGAEVHTFRLEEHRQAEEYAVQHGDWKNYTYVLPNSGS